VANKCVACLQQIPRGEPVYWTDGKTFCESCYLEYKKWKRKQGK